MSEPCPTYQSLSIKKIKLSLHFNSVCINFSVHKSKNISIYSYKELILEMESVASKLSSVKIKRREVLNFPLPHMRT